MKYVNDYDSPLGRIVLAAADEGLSGLWFEGQKHFGAGLAKDARQHDSAIFDDAKRWLDEYFAGRQPNFIPKLHFVGTEFQRRVWQLLLLIPRGTTMTYGGLARAINMRSARAIGGAVARNKISIIVPCHRVIGANGRLLGYSGGLDKKARLLELEGLNVVNDERSVRLGI